MKWQLGFTLPNGNWCLFINEKPYFSQLDKENMPYLMFEMSHGDLVAIRDAINEELGVK